MSSPDDLEEREADAVADRIMRSTGECECGGGCGDCSGSANALGTGSASVPSGSVVHRDATPTPSPQQPGPPSPADDVQKPRDQPSQWPPQEQPKTGTDRTTDFEDKYKKGGGKAGGQALSMLSDEFSKTFLGKRISDGIENDPVVRFFTKTPVGIVSIIALGAGGLAAGLLAEWSARDAGAPGAAPKDEKLTGLQLTWDFLSPPTGYTLKTPWLDSPTVPKPKPTAEAPLGEAPQLMKATMRGPGICTPTSDNEPEGTAFIYLWLTRKRDAPAASPPQLRAPQMGPSPFTPMFSRAAGPVRPHYVNAIVHGLASAGVGLDAGDRAFMERRFGSGFGQVRVHAGADASAAAAAVNANAFTVGREVVFGGGKYTPGTAAGRRLLAHELTHVVQQGDGPSGGLALQRSGETPAPAAGASPPAPPVPTYVSSARPQVAFVREEGLNLHVAADLTSTSLARLPFGTRVRVLEDEALHPGWQKVLTPTGATGFLSAPRVHFPPPDLIARDPGLTMVRVRAGQTFWGLVKEQYGIRGNESTADQNINHFINAIRAVNKGDAFIVKTDWLDDVGNWLIGGRDASDTLLKAGYDLWIPSFGVAAAMDVGSGTVSGEVARLIKKIEQLLNDFKDAAVAAGRYIPAAVMQHAGEAALGLLTGLVDFALDAAKILAISTAVGALLGSLFGGVGALPGAEIGFEIGMLILEVYGLAMLAEAVLGIAGNLLGQLASFVGQVWNANGDPKKIDEAGKTLADALGILVSAVLIVVAAYLMKKGADALAKTKFAEKVGRSNLGKWLADRQKLTTTRSLDAKATPPVSGARGVTASGSGDSFKIEAHPAASDPVIETRRPGSTAQQRPSSGVADRPAGSTAEDIAAVHDELTQGTGRGQRSSSEASELNASSEQRVVDAGELDELSPRFEGDRFDAKMTEEDLALVAQELFPEYSYDPVTKGEIVYKAGKPVKGRPKGSTVPDLYLRGRRARVGDPRLPPLSLEAKNYFLGDAAMYEEFVSATVKQGRQRVAALPKSAQQHLVIDLRGQHPSPGFVDGLRRDLVTRSGGIFKYDRIHFLLSGP